MSGNTNNEDQYFIDASNVGLLRFVQSRIDDKEEAHSILQEAYLKFFKAGYDSQSASARPLLFTIAKNLLKDHYRKQQRTNELLLSGTEEYSENVFSQESDPVDDLHSARQLKKVIRAIERMPLKRQQVFRLSRFDGLKNREISMELTISMSMVEKHLAAALKDLRSVLESWP
ncbi:MAG: sigma-70 family RNA polymerase sigma factor [Photobacterium frigidiphilum]|uniref:RNA polymerase sigma factor n=1 Tax=Photobacterium frigidiphilum TaxID=264736 RepID=UPI003001F9DC